MTEQNIVVTEADRAAAAKWISVVQLQISERFTWQEAYLQARALAVAALRERSALLEERDHPETEDFMRGIALEAAHQRARWPSEHDAGKAPADWFWLIGYLAGKCLAAHIAGNRDKALHHTISSAAALANWHLAIKGHTSMRPGTDVPTEARAA